MPCIPCSHRLHEECFMPVLNEDELTYNCCCYTNDDVEQLIVREIGKSDDALKDVISTGRKRAAQLKPIIEDMICEWAFLLEAGGGEVPIIGCNGTTLTKEKGHKVRTGNIHHGPDKSTLNNSDENLHRICGQCHNRWHALNDPLYPSERPPNGEPFLPLSGTSLAHNKHTLATDEQRLLDAEWWAIPSEQRDPSTYRSFLK